MKIPFFALILQGIPEQIALITTIWVIANIPLRWKEIISIGIGMAFTVYILRLLPNIFGIHTIILAGLFISILIRFYEISIYTSILATLISMLLLILFETTVMNVAVHFFDITFITLESNVVTRILITWPQVILMFLSAFIFQKFKAGRITR